MKKLDELKKQTGLGFDALMNSAMYEGIAWGICKNPACDYTTESVEPDCREGYCEICGTETVASCMVLAGRI